MLSLKDKKAALEAGDYDVVLEGTKYAGAKTLHDGWSAYSCSPNQQMKYAMSDGIMNAAKVIVLEEQVWVLREALHDMSEYVNSAKEQSKFIQKHGEGKDFNWIDDAVEHILIDLECATTCADMEE